MKHYSPFGLALALMLAAGSSAALADVTSAFTYQGVLNQSGAPANGVYDMRFTLYTAASSGSIVGAAQCANDVVVTDGKFSVMLDFGAQFSGQSRFLEIQVRPDTGTNCSTAAGLVALTPRQELTAAPNAAFALAAANATTAATASTATNALSIGGQPAANVALLNASQTFTGAVNITNAASTITGSFAGNGSMLTALSGGNISAGTISRSRVGSDVESVLAQWSPHAGNPAGITLIDGVAWGRNGYGEPVVPALPGGVTYTALAGGNEFNLGLRSDGSIIGWGRNSDGQTTIPALSGGLTYTAIAAGYAHSLGLRSNGSLVAWGWNGYGQTTVPALPGGVTYTKIEAGERHSLALRSDGQVVAFGQGTGITGVFGDFGQIVVPALPGGTTYTAVSAGNFHSLALRSDGQVVAWGAGTTASGAFLQWGQSIVPALPPGITYTAIAAGAEHSAAIRSDGSIIAWGHNNLNQTVVPSLPAGVTYTAISAGNNHTAALRSDGQIVAWGTNSDGQLNVPSLPAGNVYASVATWNYGTLATRGTPVVAVPPSLSSNVGISIGSSTPPATGGLSVAGASVFGSGVTASTFTGSGAGLTNLSAANLTGIIPTAVLTGANGSGLTNLNGAALTAGSVPRTALASELQGVLATTSVPAPGALVLTGSSPTGNAPFFVTVSGSRAYVANYTSKTLEIFDVSNPASPTHLGAAATLGTPFTIALSGTLAYVTTRSPDRVQVFDVSNPASPMSLGAATTENGPFALAVSGTYAYEFGDAGDLEVFNFSTPSSPVRIGHVNMTCFYAHSIALAGSYAYVSGIASNGLYVVNISNPASPVVVGHVDLPSNPEQVAVSGSFAYLVMGDNTFRVIDISNPSAPLVVGTASTANVPNSVAISGSYAYIANAGASTLQVFDISNPANPVQLTTSPGIAAGTNTVGVAASGQTVYVLSSDTNTLNVFTPPAPTTTYPSAPSVFSGSVGIGTSNLSSKLTVAGIIESTSGGIKFPDGTVQTTSGGGQLFTLSGSAAVYTAGSVGVGTTTPQARLDVRAANASETAIRGLNTATGTNIGVYGEVVNGDGVFGKSTATTGSNYGVYGQTLSTASTAFGVYSNGRLGSSGTKSFMIDHPLDPAHKFLFHYSAESPEAINFYRGTVVLDEAGNATIHLPDYFAAINIDPSYILTAVGAPMPLLHIGQEIDLTNAATQSVSFVIAGGQPGQKVSWEVKARRNDAYVARYGAPVEVRKTGLEDGKYIRPELFSAAPESAISAALVLDWAQH